jgi:hypothetical protein
MNPLDLAWSILKEELEEHPGQKDPLISDEERKRIDERGGYRDDAETYPVDLAQMPGAPFTGTPDAKNKRPLVSMNVAQSPRDTVKFAQEMGMTINEAAQYLADEAREDHRINVLMQPPSGNQRMPLTPGKKILDEKHEREVADPRPRTDTPPLEPSFVRTPFQKPEEGMFHTGVPMDLSWRFLKNEEDEEPQRKTTVRMPSSEDVMERHRREQEEQQRIQQELGTAMRGVSGSITPHSQEQQRQAADAEEEKLARHREHMARMREKYPEMFKE